VGTDEKGISRTTDGGARWSLTGLRSNARAFALAAGGTAIYAGVVPDGTDVGGVLASEDGGTSWQPRNGGLSNLSAQDLALDPRNPEALWAALGPQGLFRRAERGEDWHPGPGPPGGSGVFGDTRIAFSADGAALYTVDGGALWRTGDDGASWQRLPEAGTGPILPISLLLANPQDPAVLYVANSGELHASRDRGATWKSIWPGFPCGFTTLAAGPAVLYAVGTVNVDPLINCRRTAAVLLVRSTDGGASWSAADNGLPGPPRTIHVVAIDPADSQTVYAGISTTSVEGAGVWKSTDGGASWRRVGPEPALPVSAIAISPVDGTLWASGQRSIDLPAEVFASRDAGATWSAVGGPQTYSIASLVPDLETPDRLYAVGAGGVWMLEEDP
jgi:photosystem II stability/assembly factor-like uncharacterized protein